MAPQNRRAFLSTLIAGSAGALLARGMRAAPEVAKGAAVSVRSAESGSFLLSASGSGRATAYDNASKIVTANGRTHVAWLDSVPEGFRVRIRTLDRATGEWSSVYTVGEAMDNHGGPALTIDGEGYLHVLYYPHHKPMRHRRSARPHDASAWEPEIGFGEKLSYPVVLCAKDGTLLMTARRYTEGQRTCEVQLWEKSPASGWQFRSTLLKSRTLDYAQFGESLAWGPDHRTIHLGCRYYETAPEADTEPWQTVGYLRSPDGGHTWTKADGTPVTLPVTADGVEVLDRGGGKSGRTLAAGGLAVSAKGEPSLVHGAIENGHGRIFVSTLRDGRWRRSELNAFLPDEWREWSGYLPGALTYGGRGELIVVAGLANPPRDVKNAWWGHASTEIACFRSRDGGERFSFSLLSAVDAHEPHWLPNIERPTGFHRVPEAPGVIYTAGAAGGGLKDILTNQVWWRTVG